MTNDLENEFDQEIDLENEFDQEIDLENEFDQEIEDSSEPEEVSVGTKLDAARRGLETGTTLGLDDIIAGFSGALGHAFGMSDYSDEEKEKLAQIEKDFKIKDEDKTAGLEGILGSYKQSKKERVEETEDLRDKAGGYMLAGELAGGALTGGLASSLNKAGKLGKMSKILPSSKGMDSAKKFDRVAALGREGAKAGAIYGFGKGESNLAEGDVLGTIKDTVTSGITGGLLGAGAGTGIEGLKGLYKGGKWAIKELGDLPIVHDAKAAFGYAMKDESVLGKGARQAQKEFSDEMKDVIMEDFLPKLKEQRVLSSNKMGEIYKQAEDIYGPHSVEDVLLTLEKQLDNVTGISSDSVSAIQSLKTQLKNLKKVTKGVRRIDSPEYSEAKKLAREELEKKVNQEITSAKIRGDDVQFGKPVVDYSSDTVMIPIRRSKGSKQVAKPISQKIYQGKDQPYDEAVSEATKALKKKQSLEIAKASEMGETVTFTKPKLDPDSDSLISIRKQEPIFDESSTFLKEKIKYKPSETSAFPDKMTPQQIADERQYLNDIISGVDKNDKRTIDVLVKAKQRLKDLEMSSVGELSDDLTGASSRYGASAGIEEAVSKKVSEHLKGDPENVAIELTSYMNKLEGSSISAIEKVQKFEKLKKELFNLYKMTKEQDPTSAENLKDILNKTIPKMESLAEKFSLVTSTQQTGLLGLKGLSPKGTAVRTGDIAGRLVKGASEQKKGLQEGFQKLFGMSDANISKISEGLAKTGKVGANYARVLNQLAGTSDTKKTAILYGLYQQPAFRKLIKRESEELDEYFNE